MPDISALTGATWTTLTNGSTITHTEHNTWRTDVQGRTDDLNSVVADLEDNYASSSAPTDKPEGKLWCDNTNDPAVMKYYVDGASTLETLAGLTLTQTFTNKTLTAPVLTTPSITSGDLTMYEATNDGSPEIRIGGADAEELHIQTVYDSGAQTLNYVLFQTDTASATADRGEFRFNVDGTEIGQINDSGVNVVSGLAYYIADTSVLNATTLGSAVVTSSLTTVGALASGSIAAGFGAIDNGTSNITTGGILKLDVDGTAENAAGSLTLGAGNDAGLFFDGTDLVMITNGAGASGIILDSEDDTLEIKGSGTLQATFDTGGLNLASGDAYSIAGTSVLNATDLGVNVATSSLTTVGALDGGSITSNFGTIDIGTSALDCGALTSTGINDDATSVAITIDSSENVGIGTTSPTSALDVSGAGTTAITTAAFSADANSNYLHFAKSRHATVGSHTIVADGDFVMQIRGQGSNGTSFDAAVGIYGAIDGTPGASTDMPGRLTFWTTPNGSGSLSERMRIDSSGNVGIGTTSPSVPLHIVNDGSDGDSRMRITSSHASGGNAFINFQARNVTGSSTMSIGQGKGTTNFSVWGSNDPDDAGSELFTVDQSGNVGIGTTSPSAKFEVHNTSDASVNVFDLYNDNGNNIYSFSQSSGGEPSLSFKSDAGGTLFRLDTSGNVGIGTTSPSSLLEIETDQNAMTTLSVDNNTAGTGAGSRLLVEADAMALVIDAFSSTFTTSASSIADGARIVTNGNASGGLVVGTQASADLQFFTADTSRVTVDSSGNVGIGGTPAAASSVGNLSLFNGTAPTGSETNGIVLYSEDVSASAELKVRDEAGNTTTLSPHNFDLIPEGPSEDMAWSYYSERDGKKINIDMLKAIRVLERMSGEKLVHEGA